MAPPRLPKLPVKLLPLTVAVPLSQMPSPKPRAVLPVKVLPLTVNIPPMPAPLLAGALSIPPPLPTAELPVKVLRMTVAVPPTSLSRPPPLVAELPEKTTSLTVSAPKLSMPPPLLLKSVPALPPAIVRPEMDTVSPASTWKTRERLLPLTVSLAAPGPVIARSPVMSSSPPVRAMVPVSPAWKSMTSAPGWALARATAARSEPAPLSARVVTWNVDGTMRASSDSSPSRARAGFRTTAAGRPRPRNHFETELRMDISYLQGEEGARRARGNNTRVVGAPAAPGSGRGGDVAGHAPAPRSRQGTGGTGGPLRSGEDVGRLVVDEPVAGLRQQPARLACATARAPRRCA